MSWLAGNNRFLCDDISSALLIHVQQRNQAKILNCKNKNGKNCSKEGRQTQSSLRKEFETSRVSISILFYVCSFTLEFSGYTMKCGFQMISEWEESWKSLLHYKKLLVFCGFVAFRRNFILFSQNSELIS